MSSKGDSNIETLRSYVKEQVFKDERSQRQFGLHVPYNYFASVTLP